MGVARSAIRRARDLNGRCLIGDIDDGHGVLVGGKAEFFPAKSRIGSCIRHAFDVVGVPIGAEATHPSGCQGIGYVHHVKTAAAGTRPHRVGKAGNLVDPEVVRVGEPRVMHCRGKRGRRAGNIAQLGQVKDLHAVSRGFAHDERVVAVDLHIAPVAVHCLCRQIPKVDRNRGIADVHE